MTTTTTTISPKANSLAIERMREMDEQERLEKICTKQKRGTPIVSQQTKARIYSLLKKTHTHTHIHAVQRDIGLQQKVLNWMIEILDERPKKSMDYDHWIHDGTVLVKVMQYVMFNSVPLELVLPVQNLNTKEDRVKTLLKYLRRFGVPEEYIFQESDLFDFKNIPKVTRCVAMLAKMVREKNMLNRKVFFPLSS